MNRTDLVAQENARREAYERATVADQVNGRPVTIAELREVMDSVQSSTHWKAAFAVYADHKLVPYILAAIRFYHGAAGYVGGMRPLDGWVLVGSDGYACD